MSRRRLVWQSFAANRRGGVAIIAAAGGALLCVLAALAVDLGSIALHARKVQGAADLAALSAARDLAAAQRAAEATVQANLGDGAQVRVFVGTYSPNSGLAAHMRFSAVAAGEAPDAAQVEVSHPARLFFARAILRRESIPVTRMATAALEPQGAPLAAFSIGSRLARLDGGVANALLSGLAGGSVNLSVMDYEALLDADVDLLTWLDALAVELDVHAADYHTLLATEVEAGRALTVLERLLDGRSQSAVSEIARATDGATLTIGELVGVTGGLGRNIQATVSAMDLATAVLEVAGGERQVQLDLGVNAGLASTQAWLAIGERPNDAPWMTVTDRGAPIIRTAQARLYIKARTVRTLSGLARVDLPVLIELAASESRLVELECRPARRVVVEARPGVARAWIGAIDENRLDDFRTPLEPTRATLLSVSGLVTVTGRADIEAADAGWTALTFTGADIDGGAIRTVRTTGAVSGLASSLLQRLDVDVDVIGLGLGLGGLTRALGDLLSPLGPVLDGLVNPLLDLLGLKIGEADIRMHGLSCPADGGLRPVLVG
ncbi:MAG: putative membrane protein [Brevundimonas sp.]|jgi:uncharacterized membrane protein|uniref:pilus assembly protein TadG-related protein n=1 Tax=Brevundimonas sp. TaxID=1871086 RepID=UPI0039E27A1F